MKLNITNVGDQQFPPEEAGYLEETRYRVVHFHGPRLSDSLAKAAYFLSELEELLHREPQTLAMSSQYSWEDEATEFAWRVTLILAQPDLEGDLSRVRLESTTVTRQARLLPPSSVENCALTHSG